MSASRVTTSAAEKSSGKHKRKSKNKNRSTEGSAASTGPVADFQEADFPLLGSQAPPDHPKKENLSNPIRATHQIIKPQPTPLLSVGVQRYPLLHVPSQHPPLYHLPTVVGQQPLLSVVGRQPLLVGQPPALPQETPPQPCLQNNQKLVFPNPDTPDEFVPPAHPSFYPTMTSATSDLSMRLTFTDARGRQHPPLCHLPTVVGQQPLLSVVGQQPLLSVKPPALPQETPPQPCLQNNQKLVFPNPDTPDEFVPPAHPSFYPTMTPATSDLSMRLTFTDARGRQRPPLCHLPTVVGQQPLLSVVGQQPLLSVKPPALPQETPPQPCLQNNQKLVFPNPDTPDELVPPAHPSFYPTMTPATSDLSMRLTFTDARGRPDNPKVAADKINTRLNAIIDDLGAKGKFVPAPVVKDFKDKLLKQCYHARCSVNSRDIRAFDEYSKAHGRIEQLIRIFCWMSPITTLYELEKSLVSSEKVTTFQELRMGPLIKHPLVTKFFQPPHYLQEIPEITAHQIQKTLMKFLDKTRKKAATRGDRHSVEDFLEFFAKSLSKTSPLDLCVRITSFPLAIQVSLFMQSYGNQLCILLTSV